MCGIAGIVHFDGKPIGDGVIGAMCAAIEHRGPDHRGILQLPRDGSSSSGRAAVALGNQRLSIIDIGGGDQPIGNEDGTVWTVLNGEIYNFRDLRDELTRAGHRFATRSDTEVIVHAYEQWGDGFLERLDGMFALAVWDDSAERLVLARDRFGKKPLLYFDDGARFAFASEFQALLHVPGLPRDIDAEALGEYLTYLAIPAPRTIYQRIKKVRPAHSLTRDRARTCERRYWTLTYQPKSDIDQAEAVERVSGLLKEAVRKRLVGEVPIGAFLSGGVDSSAVVAMMAELASGPVSTFSIGFDEPQFDELAHARRVAHAFGCEHHEFVVRPSAVEVLPALAQHVGEPFADSSAIPSWYLAKLTREHVTVALTGDGGDEVFAGYGRHVAAGLAERWQQVRPMMRRPAEWVARRAMLADVGGARFSRFVANSALSRSARYRAWSGVCTPDLINQLTGRIPGDDETVEREFASAEHLDAIDSALAVDTRFYLPTDLLVKADITSMAHSLEVRSPLLDQALAEFVAPLPTSLKLHRYTTKRLLKQAVKTRVPSANLRRRKQGFAVPIARWLRDDLRSFVSAHLQPSRLAQAGLLRQDGIDRLITEQASARTGTTAHQLWTVLMLELWHRAFVHP